MKTIVCALVCLLWLAFAVPSCLASRVEVEAEAVAVLEAAMEAKDVRLLLRFPLPEEVKGRSVDFACISLVADCASEKGMVSLQAFPVTTEWESESVAWDKSLGAFTVSEAGTGETLEFDVTEFVNGWLAEPEKNLGVVVKASAPYWGTPALSKGRLPKLTIVY
ncbi:MAG: DNRLRE domain-containing protein [Candidatus Eisenbacteria bacterium]